MKLFIPSEKQLGYLWLDRLVQLIQNFPKSCKFFEKSRST